MSNYLLKYKGQYRILAELDINTNDIPRDRNGEIAEGYDDLYIPCGSGDKIYAYGAEPDNKRLIYLMGYSTSTRRGHNILKALAEKDVEIKDICETDAELEFKFKAKDIDIVAAVMKAKTYGANISPYSTRNLPKTKYVIPENDVRSYKDIISVIDKTDMLVIKSITDSFMKMVLQKILEKSDKTFSYRKDMKKNCMATQTKEYIHSKGLWSEYLSFLKDEISKTYLKLD